MTEKNNKRDTKEKILNETKNLFAEKGFDNTGINEIAKRVGIAPSVIYYHFENKNDILNTLINNYLQKIIEFKEESKAGYFSEFSPKKLRELNEKSMNILFDKELTRIIFMESLKKADKNPIFKLWEENIYSLIKIYNDKLKPDILENKAKYLFKTFLMIGLPRFGYEVFVEQWCDYYNMNREEAKEIFIESTTEYYEKIIKNDLWEM